MVTSWSGNGTVRPGPPDLAAGTTYVPPVSGQDRQGNNLVPRLVPNPWTFTINDPPRVSAPALSLMGCLNGGSTIAITWTMVDDLDRPEDLIVTLAYRNGTRLEPIVGPVTGFPSPAVHAWTLPIVDLTTNVTVEAKDSAGAISRNWSGEFRIDTFQPVVGSTSPAARAAGRGG